MAGYDYNPSSFTFDWGDGNPVPFGVRRTQEQLRRMAAQRQAWNDAEQYSFNQGGYVPQMPVEGAVNLGDLVPSPAQHPGYGFPIPPERPNIQNTPLPPMPNIQPKNFRNVVLGNGLGQGLDPRALQQPEQQYRNRNGGVTYEEWRPLQGTIEEYNQRARQRAIYGETGPNVPQVSDDEMAAREPPNTRMGAEGGHANLPNPRRLSPQQPEPQPAQPNYIPQPNTQGVSGLSKNAQMVENARNLMAAAKAKAGDVVNAGITGAASIVPDLYKMEPEIGDGNPRYSAPSRDVGFWDKPRYSAPNSPEGSGVLADVPTESILPSYQLAADNPVSAVDRARDIRIAEQAREAYNKPSNPAPPNTIVSAEGKRPNGRNVSQATMRDWEQNTFRQTDAGRMSVPEAAKMRDEQVASGQMSSYQRPDNTTWYSTKPRQ